MGKRRYITFKVDEELGDVPGLSSYGPAREPLGVRCGRCMRFTGFCLVCTGTLFQALAPWMLSVIEVATLLLLLLLLLLPAHPPGPYDFRFDSSLEDVAVLGAARAASISATYAYGSKRYQLRPYLITSYVLGCAGFVYALLKAAYFVWPLAWLPPAGMLLTFGCFSWLHILAARHTVTWARRQGMLGLAPFNPLAGGIIRRSASAGSLLNASPCGGGSSSSSPQSGLPGAAAADADVPPELLADPDSRFIAVQGITVHYKEAWPAAGSSSAAAAGAGAGAGSTAAAGSSEQAAAAAAAAWIMPEPAAAAAAAAEAVHDAEHTASSAPDDVAVVLVHGFGGGTFAWRHVLQPLATAVGARVVAFDRPGFGLTSRPEVVEDDAAAAAAAAAASSRGSSPRDSSSTSCRKRAAAAAQPHEQASSSSSSSQQQQHWQPLLRRHYRTSQQQQQQQQRPRHNPYSIEAHAHLTLRLCAALGVKHVVLVGHADGCLVVVHAAAAACRAARYMRGLQQQQQQQQQQRRSYERAGHPRHIDIPLQPEGSIDFSWMGSLGEDPTPRTIQRVAQAAQQQQAGSNSSSAAPSPIPIETAAAAAAAAAATTPFAEPAAAVGLEPAVPVDNITNRLLEDARAAGDMDHGDGTSLAASISFQSMLLAAASSSSNVGSGSRQQLADLDEGIDSCSMCEEAASSTAAAGVCRHGSGDGSGDGSVHSRAGSSSGELAAAAAGRPQAMQQQQQQLGSSGELDSSSSLVLRPPKPQAAMSAPAAAGSGGGLPPLPGHPSPSPRGGSRLSKSYNTNSISYSRRDSSASSDGAAAAAAAGGVAVEVEVVGLALLHPNLSGHQVPPFTRLLGGSSLGRSMLRPLLRSEVGEVSNRRAWAHPELITRDVLALYSRPLRVQGWDAALLATSRAAGAISHKRVAAQFAAARQLPTLLVTGEHDRIATPAKVSAVAALLLRTQRAVVPDCGHLSHEEAPGRLLQLLVPFCRSKVAAASSSSSGCGGASGGSSSSRAGGTNSSVLHEISRG